MEPKESLDSVGGAPEEVAGLREDLRAVDFARRADFFAPIFFAVLLFAPARLFLRAGAAFLAFFAFVFDFDLFAFFAMIGSRSVAGQV
jgi:hypothetical protein